MTVSTTVSMSNGKHRKKLPHTFSQHNTGDDVSLAQQRLHSYMSSRNGGGDPVTALGVRNQTILFSMSERRIKVLRSLVDNTIKYENGNNSGA